MKSNLDNKIVEISHKNRYIQFFYMPYKICLFFILSRIARIFKTFFPMCTNSYWGKKICGNIPDPNFSSIYLYGFLDEAVTKMIENYVKPGMVCFDIGAHIGYETLQMQHLLGNKGCVFAFEPTPNTYKLLCRNVVGIDNVVTNNIAVWSKSEILTLYDYGPERSGLNGFFNPRMPVKKGNTPFLKLKICVTALDDYCRKYHIHPDFIKIDAESAEYNILEGMKKILKKVKPIIIIEIGDIPSDLGKTIKCIRLMQRYGYKAYEYTVKGITKHKIRKDYVGIYENLLFKIN